MIKQGYRLMIVFCVLFQSTFAQQPDIKKVFSDAEKQSMLMINTINNKKTNRLTFPRSLDKDSLKLVPSGDWTSGFWPGILWLEYEQSQKPELKEYAETFTRLMEKEQWNTDSHDVGFKIYCSYGNALRLTGIENENYKAIIIQAAKTLCKRFNPVTGCIKSWNSTSKWKYPVIIDNMMNLELLFAATRFSNDSSFYKVAVSHANTTLKNHFRSDHSSYHVVDYDTITGNVIQKNTAQGYADESAWARGQAWGLYGFTMCYRETKNIVYLKQAEDIAAFILDNPDLPDDKIPYWDYNVPDKIQEPRDASAAAITASALYELSNYSTNKKKYREAAGKILESLTRNYRSAANTNGGFILNHSTGHKPAKSEIDVPIIYADYYYLEALLRSKKK
ncbi:MAG: glycoside hydrolase family 88 protein [Ferruginibacter sp.]